MTFLIAFTVTFLVSMNIWLGLRSRRQYVVLTESAPSPRVGVSS
jgi:hypothetical protein